MKKLPKTALHGAFTSKPEAEKAASKVRFQHPLRTVSVGTTKTGRYFVKSSLKRKA